MQQAVTQVEQRSPSPLGLSKEASSSSARVDDGSSNQVENYAVGTIDTACQYMAVGENTWK